MATKKAKPFTGVESYKEEFEEATQIKEGKLSPKRYAKKEQAEPKMKCGGKVKKMAKGGTPDSEMVDQGSYSMGKPPTLRDAIKTRGAAMLPSGSSDNSMTLPGSSRPANRPTSSGSGYKPYTGERKVASDLTEKQIATKARVQAELRGSSSNDAVVGNDVDAAPTPAKPKTPSAPTKPRKKVTPNKPKSSSMTPLGVSREDMQAFRDANMADRVKYGMTSEPTDQESPESDTLPAYKRGGKVVKKGTTRCDGIAQRGRTRGKYC